MKMIKSKEFKQRVTKRLKEIDGKIKDNDLYFSRLINGYCISYQPNYPNGSQKDFIIYLNCEGCISVYGKFLSDNTGVRNFKNIDDFENGVELCKKIKTQTLDKCYVLICNYYNGEKIVCTFFNENNAYEAMNKESETEISNLQQKGYKFELSKNKNSVKLYVPGSVIYYKWNIEESAIQ